MGHQWDPGQQVWRATRFLEQAATQRLAKKEDSKAEKKKTETIKGQKKEVSKHKAKTKTKVL